MLAQESEAMLSHYREQGGNFIDTANAYTCGHSEEIIGDFFHQPKGKRDRAVIATAEERRFNGQVHTGERRKDAGLRSARTGDFTELAPEQITSLNTVSKPVLNFPADFLAQAPSFGHAGATVDGTPNQIVFLVPKDEISRW
jgi:hypothetical protein